MYRKLVKVSRIYSWDSQEVKAMVQMPSSWVRFLLPTLLQFKSARLSRLCKSKMVRFHSGLVGTSDMADRKDYHNDDVAELVDAISC